MGNHRYFLGSLGFKLGCPLDSNKGCLLFLGNKKDRAFFFVVSPWDSMCFFVFSLVEESVFLYWIGDLTKSLCNWIGDLQKRIGHLLGQRTDLKKGWVTRCQHGMLQMSLLLFMFLFIATKSYQTNPKSNHESTFSKNLPKRQRFLGIHLVICFYGFGPKLNRPDVLQTSLASIKILAAPVVDMQRKLAFRCHFLCFNVL